MATTRTLAGLLLGCVASIPVWADNPTEKLETSTIEVIGTTPLPGLGLPPERIPANVQSASGQSLRDQHSADLTDFLDSNLGSINLNGATANPFQPDVNYRGFAASPLLGTPQGLSVFVDGVRVNEAFGDLVNWDLIPRSAISTITVIPGSNPLFGLNTLGGALAVNTKSGFNYPGVAARVYGGSWGRRAAEFEAGGHGERVDYFVAGNIFREDGWRQHSPSDINQVFAKTGWQDDATNIDLSLTLADNRLEGTQVLPLSMLNDPAQAFSWPDSTDNRLVFLNLNASRFLSDTVLVSANAYHRRLRTEGFNSNVNDDFDPAQPNTQGLTPGRNVLFRTDQRAIGGGLQLTLLGDLAGRRNQFAVGASVDSGDTDFSQATQDAVITPERETVGVSTFETETSVKGGNRYYGLYLTDTLSLTDALHITVSGRYNLAKVKLEDRLGTALSGEHRFTRFNPAVGAAYNPVQSVTAYVNYSEGMRAPTPVELTCADPQAPCRLPNAFLSDPPLKQVVSKTWETGVRGKASGGFDWSAAVFRTELVDDILFVSSGGGASSAGFFQNVGKTRRQGLELGVHGAMGGFDLGAHYSLVDATFESPEILNSPNNSTATPIVGPTDILVSRGDRIPSIPRHTFKLRMGYALTPSWSMGANLVAASSQFARGDENNRDSHGPVPGYAVLDLDTRYRIGRQWRIFAKVNNLFDREYATFGQLGANAFVGPGNTFDPTVSPDLYPKEQFRSPGAPRALWVGVEYQLDRADGSGIAGN